MISDFRVFSYILLPIYRTLRLICCNFQIAWGPGRFVNATDEAKRLVILLVDLSTQIVDF